MAIWCGPLLWCGRGAGQDRRRGHWPDHHLANCAISADPEMIRWGPKEQDDCSVCTGLSPQRERVSWLRTPSLTGLLLSPASARRPPRGLGGGGATLRREEFGMSKRKRARPTK